MTPRFDDSLLLAGLSYKVGNVATLVAGGLRWNTKSVFRIWVSSCRSISFSTFRDRRFCLAILRWLVAARLGTAVVAASFDTAVVGYARFVVAHENHPVYVSNLTLQAHASRVV